MRMATMARGNIGSSILLYIIIIIFILLQGKESKDINYEFSSPKLKNTSTNTRTTVSDLLTNSSSSSHARKQTHGDYEICDEDEMQVLDDSGQPDNPPESDSWGSDCPNITLGDNEGSDYTRSYRADDRPRCSCGDGEESDEKTEMRSEFLQEMLDYGTGGADYKAKESFRIVNGIVSKNNVPWFVGIMKISLDFIYCGGALISPRYVVSASHCFCGSKKDKEESPQNCKEFSSEQDFTSKRLVVGIKHREQIKLGKTYEIESVRYPPERIKMFDTNKFYGPHDIALIKTTSTIYFEPGRVMPVCLVRNIQDTDIKGIVNGFGAHGAFDTADNNVHCWTDSTGPAIFERCKGPFKKKCIKEEPPEQDKICKPFFAKFGGEKAFRETERADVAIVGRSYCYPIEGIGEYGWCVTKKKGRRYWGYCSQHCEQKFWMFRGDLMETAVKVLPEKNCNNFLRGEQGFDPKYDLCGGKVITEIQVFKNYDERTFEYLGISLNNKLMIGGSDACQGDSGGPIVTFRETSFKGVRKFKAFLIGLVSRGKGCAYKNEPGIYVRISAYYDWIMEHIEPNLKCKYVS